MKSQPLNTTIIACVLSIIFCGCQGGKVKSESPMSNAPKESKQIDDNHHQKDVFLDSIQSHFAPEQLALINRKGFDKSVLSYDTTTLINSDSVPYRLLSYKERHKRIPWKKEIAGYRMTSWNWGYKYEDKEWYIATEYPGVLVYYPASMRAYVKKVEQYDKSGQLQATLDFDKLSPYRGKLPNVKPGTYNFETMSIEDAKVTDDYKNKATRFLEKRGLRPQNTTDWTVITYRLLALNEEDEVLGFESTIAVYDEKGQLQYSKVLPFDTKSAFISHDNKYLVFAPDRVEQYMPKADEIAGELFIVDLDSSEVIYTQRFDNEKIKFSMSLEEMVDNLLLVNFKEPKAKKADEEPNYVYFSLEDRVAFSQDYSVISEACKKGEFHHMIECAEFIVKKY